MTGFNSKRKIALDRLAWRCSHGWLRGEQCEICNAPQRIWVGLTNEDTFEIAERLGLSDVAWVDLMQAIEAKLKELNHG